MIAQADGERQAVTLKAEGQKQSAILQAEGERQAAVLRAKGAGAPQRSHLKAEPKRHTPTAPLHPQGRGRLPLRQNPVAHGAVHPPPNPRQEEGRVTPTSPLLRGEPDRRRPRPRHSRKASLVETRRRSSATATPQAGQRPQTRKTPSPTTETQARAEDGTPAPRRQPPPPQEGASKPRDETRRRPRARRQASDVSIAEAAEAKPDAAHPTHNPTSPMLGTAKNGVLFRLSLFFRFCWTPKNSASILPNAE